MISLSKLLFLDFGRNKNLLPKPPTPEGENSLLEFKSAFNTNAILNFEINQIKKRNMFPFRG